MQRAAVTPELTAMAFDFFFRFSRFEAALKEDKYLKSDVVGAQADPDWKLFVDRWEKQYAPSTSARRLIALAPERQVVGAGKSLTWAATKVPAGASDLAATVAMLKTVRNNLFHGGKSGAAGWDDPARTRDLLEAAHPILEELAYMAGFPDHFHRSY